MEFSRANLLSSVAIGMIFGPTFPLLYPLIAFLLLITYILEKISVFWWCPEAPSFDNQMALTSTNIMKFIPIGTLLISFK